MAFFVESTKPETVVEMESVIVDDYTNFDELALEACAEVERMDNMIMEGLGRYELDRIHEGVAAEEIYTEGALATIKDKIAKIFTFVKNWVKALFNKFTAWINSYVRGDKAFLSKYRKQISDNIQYLNTELTYKLPCSKEIFLGVADTSNTFYNKYEVDGTFKNVDKDSLEKARESAKENMEKLNEDIFEGEEITGAWIKSNINGIIKVIEMDASKVKNLGATYVKAIETLEKAALTGLKEDTDGATISGVKSMAKIKTQQISSICSKHCQLVKKCKSAARRMATKCINAKALPKYESAFEHSDLDAYINL